MSLRFTLDGDEIAPPQNWKELEVELDFDNNSARLASNDFEFLGETASFINKWVEDGCNDGVGLLEPPKFNVDDICENGVFNLLESVLKLDEADFACDLVKTPIQELGNIDFLENIADSFSFWYLTQLDNGVAGKINSSDYTELFYSTKDIPDGATLAMLSFMIFTIIKEIVENIKRIVDTLGSGSQYPLVGEAIIQIIALSVYLTILTIQLILLTKQVFDALIPVPRKHSGIKVVTLFEKACEYLGYTFSSTIFYGDYNNTVILPTKDKDGNIVTNSTIQDGYYDGTFSDLITEINFHFNTKVTLIGNTLHLERIDFFKNQSTYQVPDVRKEFNGTNANELNFNFLYSYGKDSSDLQSLNNYNRATFSHTVTPNVTNQNGSIVPFSNSIDKKGLLLKGLDDRKLAFGQIHGRKDCENELEKILLFVTDVGFNVNAVLNTFVNDTLGVIFPSLADRFQIGHSDVTQPVVSCRVGFAEFQTSLINLQRIYIHDDINDNLVASNSLDLLAPQTLFNTFHYINSPLPIGDNTEGNQWITYKDLIVPFTCSDFQEIKEQGHNYIKFNDKGTVRNAKINSLKFNPFDCTANINLSIQKRWTCNLRELDSDNDFTSILEIFSEFAEGLTDQFAFLADNPFLNITEMFEDFTGVLEDFIIDLITP